MPVWALTLNVMHCTSRHGPSGGAARTRKSGRAAWSPYADVVHGELRGTEAEQWGEH